MKEYIDNFLNEINTDKFFVMPGLRGVGKTTILYQLYDYLLNTKKIESTKVLYLDLERLKDELNLNLLEFFDIFIKVINEKYQFTDEALFIFVDESQYDHNWASAGKIVFDETGNFRFAELLTSSETVSAGKDTVSVTIFCNDNRL